MNEKIINNNLEEVVIRRQGKSIRFISSRDYFDKKDAWALGGLGVYVSDLEIAEDARKKMMSIYRATVEQVILPKPLGGECRAKEQERKWIGG